MSVDKRVKYDVQGGVKNYLGKQKEVKAPIKWQSSPDHPTTELAYITEAEKDLLVKSDLHGSLKGGVNRGPSGIMSLNGWGSYDDPSDPSKDTGMSGVATSAAETGSTNEKDIKEVQAYMGPKSLPPGVMPQEAKDYQLAAISAGAGKRVNPGFFDSKYTISPDLMAQAKKYSKDPNNLFANQAFKKTHGGGLGSFISGGGFFGNLIRGLGQRLGLGKKYNEPTYDMSGYNTLGLGGTGQEGFGVPTLQGDYDLLGNKIDEITGEITSPTGQSLGFLPGYPGEKEGIETIIPVTSGSDDYAKLVEQFLPKSTMPEDEDLLGGFKSRFLQNRTPEEREAIEEMINEKFKYDYPSFGLGDMDGS